MKFYEVQPALESGQKIRRTSMYENVLGISLSKCLRNVYVEVFADGSESIWEMDSHDLRADDWEIIGDSKTESKMDFSDALKALKEGKKVRRQSFRDHYIEIIENVDSIKGTSYSLAIFQNSKLIADYEVTNADLFAKDWDIFEPKKVIVKTKTVEYITCSNCKKDIEVSPNTKKVICDSCKNEMILERPMTLEDAISLFNEKYYSNIGELPIINLPSLGVSEGVQQGTIKVVNIDPLQTILEFEYSP